MKTPLQESVQDFSRSWKRLFAADLVYKAIAFVLLTPLVGIVFQAMIRFSGSGALSDVDILVFLIGPIGWATLILVGGLALAVAMLGQATLLAILHTDSQGESAGVLSSVAFSLRNAQAVFGLTWRIVVRVLLLVLPFAAVAGVVYWVLLREYDINYYLNEKPPEFLIALGIGGVLLAALAVLGIRMLSRWVFALPQVLFEETSPADALPASEVRAAEHFGSIVRWFTTWLVASSLVAALVSAAVSLVGRMIVPTSGGSLSFLVFAIGITLTLTVVVNFLVNLLSVTTFATMLYGLYVTIGGGEQRAADSQHAASSSDAFGLELTRGRVASALVIGVLVSVVIGVFAANSVPLEDNVAVMAHRGASVAAPENTLAAIRQAIEDEADWVEIDVQETADGEVVVFHDSDFMKLAGVNLKIWDATMDDIRSIDIGSKFDPAFAGERVPTLAQVLETCKGKIGVNIELKYYGHDVDLERKVGRIVDEYGMASDVLAMSLKPEAVKKMKALRPDWDVGLLLSVAAGDIRALEADFFAINAGFANAPFIRTVHEMDKEVYVWTVNDAATMSVMISRGVDGLLTDKPALARSVLRQREELTWGQRLLLEFAGMLGVKGEIAEQ